MSSLDKGIADYSIRQQLNPKELLVYIVHLRLLFIIYFISNYIKNIEYQNGIQSELSCHAMKWI